MQRLDANQFVKGKISEHMKVCMSWILAQGDMRVCVCMYVCMQHVCVYVYSNVYARMHENVCVHVYVHLRMYVCILDCGQTAGRAEQNP